jgi:hypothetical protein
MPTIPPTRKEGFAATKFACGPGCGESDGPPEAEGWLVSTVAGLRRLSWPDVGRDVARESWRLGRWLLLAFVVEALILAYVPQGAIAGTLGGGNLFAVPLAALIGAPLYLTEVAALADSLWPAARRHESRRRDSVSDRRPRDHRAGDGRRMDARKAARLRPLRGYRRGRSGGARYRDRRGPVGVVRRRVC